MWRLAVRASGSIAGVVALCAALAMLGGCGRKTPVRPPEAVAPETITNLRAANVVEGIRLTWERPRETADGTPLFDLDGFRIERSTGDEPFGTVGRVRVTDRALIRQKRDFSWADPRTEDGVTYRYRVIAYTVDGYESEPSNVVEMTRVRLEKPPLTAPTPAP